MAMQAAWAITSACMAVVFSSMRVGDAGVGIDDDFVCQPHVPAPVASLGGQKNSLAITPVPVVHRHAHAGVGVHHLLGGDDLQLVGVGVEPVAVSRLANDVVVALDEFKGPVAGRRQGLAGTRRRGQRRGWHHVLAAFAHGGQFPGLSVERRSSTG